MESSKKIVKFQKSKNIKKIILAVCDAKRRFFPFFASTNEESVSSRHTPPKLFFISF